MNVRSSKRSRVQMKQCKSMDEQLVALLGKLLPTGQWVGLVATPMACALAMVAAIWLQLCGIGVGNTSDTNRMLKQCLNIYRVLKQC